MCNKISSKNRKFIAWTYFSQIHLREYGEGKAYISYSLQRRTGCKLMKLILLICIPYKKKHCEVIYTGEEKSQDLVLVWLLNLLTECEKKTWCWCIDAQINIQTKPSNSAGLSGEQRGDWKTNSSTLGYLHKQRICFLSLQLNKNALYWCDAASVASTKASHWRRTDVFSAHSAETSHWSAIISNLKGCPY